MIQTEALCLCAKQLTSGKNSFGSEIASNISAGILEQRLESQLLATILHSARLLGEIKEALAERLLNVDLRIYGACQIFCV
ncbi:MAG: hypothetical protein CL946_00375 [Ectothiorhodospiraceae bacterium]|nr:hypothetical protein [Ectothiorhodospiraceae bacterium]